MLEVKSFLNVYSLEQGNMQAAGYAKRPNLTEATMAVFASRPEELIPNELLGEADIEGVRATVGALGWR